MPHKSYVAGDHVLANDFNPNIADQVVASFANAAARASAWPAPPVGACSTLIDAANLGRLWVWTGTQWVPPWGTAWGVLAAPKATANQAINARADITGLTATLTLVANRLIRVAGYVQINPTASAIVATAYLNADGADVQTFQDTSEAANHPTTCLPVVVVTSTAGSHTYKMAALTGSPSAGTLASASAPAMLTVEDVGPAGPPA